MSDELDRLITMHTYCRPAGSKTERKFTHRYLVPLGCTRDAFGNWHKVIGDNPTHIWSSHTDTVHRHGGRQRLHLTSDGVLATVNGSCLGADDTAGVWLMCELIRRKVPGRYIFHYGEERGCIGSRLLVNSRPDWLPSITAVIALDRRDTSNVITHQCCARTASDAFAYALSAQLNVGLPTFDYAPDDSGRFTDSESYADDVAECTNLSVGYDGAHSRAETLDTSHALALLDRLTELDIAALPIDRIPGDSDWFGVSVWPTDDDYTLPAVRVTRVFFCRECGDECAEFQTVCHFCGCLEPVETVGESDYLDASYARAQTEIRRQIDALRPMWKDDTE